MFRDVAFMHGLLRWFKCDFFKWCNKPGCENVYCSAVPDVNPSNMESVGTERAYTTEATDGGAQMTEVYRCSVCRELTRFPRYNNPAMLLSTRRGRCGEFANTFALLCRSLGLDTRYVLDWTDHVWVEVWLPSLGRFVHADSCERALDSSLMYEAGWNKKLHTIISFGRYGINDVISRYSRKSDEIYMRRHEQLELPEISVRQSISQHDSSVYQAYVTRTVASRQSDEQSQIPEGIWDSDSVHFDTLELDSIGFKRLAAIELPVDVVDIRRRKECRDLMGMTFLRPKDVKLEEMRGRISGDIAWRVARGELGTCTTNDIID